MDRRRFLFQSSLSLGAGVWLSSCTDSKTAKSPDPAAAISYNSWEDVRKQFIFSSDRVHMSQMLLASHPRIVRDAIQKHREGFDANAVEYWEQNWITIENNVRKKAAEYMDVLPEEIALTDSTTMGLAMLYSGLRLKSGDEVLTTTHDHYATELALEHAAAKNGATVRRVSLYTDPSKSTQDEMVDALKKGISANTRVIAVTFVHSCTGVKTPIKEMASMIQEENTKRSSDKRIYFCVDGVHGFGIENISIRDIGCDFFVAGTHKWIFGPRGTGIFFARKEAWSIIQPIIPSFDYNAYGSWLDLYQKQNLTFGELCTPGGFHSFEHRWAQGEGFQFQLHIGKARVADRSHALSRKLKEGLSNIKHIKLITPLQEEVSAGINCFLVDGITPAETVARLLKKNIVASESPYKISYARLTPSIINSEEEVDRCLLALEEIKNS